MQPSAGKLPCLTRNCISIKSHTVQYIGCSLLNVTRNFTNEFNYLTEALYQLVSNDFFYFKVIVLSNVILITFTDQVELSNPCGQEVIFLMDVLLTSL